MNRLLIVIPAYNEEESIEEVVNNIKENYSQFDYVIVNDGSKDSTYSVCEKNRSIAGCEESFLIDSSEDVWSFKQLAPLMKMDLAVLSPATRFMLLLYGTPILYAPKKMVTFKNIGIDV